MQGVEDRTFRQKDLNMINNLAKMVGYAFKSSTKITSRDAKRLIQIQKELFVKNRQLAETNARRKAMIENIGDGVVG